MEKLVDGKRREGHVNETGHLVAHGVGIERAADGVLHPSVGHENPPRGDGGTEAREPRGHAARAARVRRSAWLVARNGLNQPAQPWRASMSRNWAAGIGGENR